MKIYFDTEFTGLHKDTTLISIGLVAEDGKTFYAELTDYDKSQCDEWIEKNVIGNLLYPNREGAQNDGNNMVVIGNKELVKSYLTSWLDQYKSVEFVSDVCHYDMVLLIDIFGHAFKLPSHVCAACHDINQDIARHYDVDEIVAFDKSREEIIAENAIAIKGDKHNALYDAKVIKEIYHIINN